MGKRDAVLSHFLGNPAVFADFCNGSLFDGKKVIFPEELEKMETSTYETGMDRTGKRRTINRKRDIAKLLHKSDGMAIIAVENQDESNYIMSMRCLEYDVMDYLKQLRHLQRNHREKGTLKTKREYLSGIKETDRFIPIITIVFYHGEGKWKAGRELHDILKFSGLEEIFKRLSLNYRMNIISLEDMKEENYETGLRELIGMMQRRDDKEAMRTYYLENAERFSEMDEDTYDTICVMLNHRELRLFKEKSRNTEGGTFNMCRALDEMMEESRLEGKRAGEKAGKKAGEKRLGLLIDRLLSENRTEEARAAALHSGKRKELYLKYGI